MAQCECECVCLKETLFSLGTVPVAKQCTLLVVTSVSQQHNIVPMTNLDPVYLAVSPSSRTMVEWSEDNSLSTSLVVVAAAAVSVALWTTHSEGASKWLNGLLSQLSSSSHCLTELFTVLLATFHFIHKVHNYCTTPADKLSVRQSEELDLLTSSELFFFFFVHSGLN